MGARIGSLQCKQASTVVQLSPNPATVWSQCTPRRTSPPGAATDSEGQAVHQVQPHSPRASSSSVSESICSHGGRLAQVLGAGAGGGSRYPRAPAPGARRRPRGGPAIAGRPGMRLATSAAPLPRPPLQAGQAEVAPGRRARLCGHAQHQASRAGSGRSAPPDHAAVAARQPPDSRRPPPPATHSWPRPPHPVQE